MSIKRALNKARDDRIYRGYALGVISTVATFAFLIFNFALGVLYGSIWHLSIILYYLLLFALKATILICERAWRHKDALELRVRRRAFFGVQNVFLIVVDTALVAPLTLIFFQKKAVSMGQIAAIAIAAYTTYKITMATVSYFKYKKTDNLSLEGLKIISVKEAIVSVMTLQNTLISVFGDPEDMLALTAWTNLGMLALMIGISVFRLVKSKNAQKSEVKVIKNKRNSKT